MPRHAPPELAHDVITRNAGVAYGEGEGEGTIVDESDVEGVADAVGEAVGAAEGVPEGDAPSDSVAVRDGVPDLVCVVDGVAEHESATARPVAEHPPHMHGSGADDASGQ